MEQYKDPALLTRTEAFGIFYKRLNEGLEQMRSEYGDDLKFYVRESGDPRWGERWIGYFNHYTSPSLVRSYFARAEQWLKDPVHSRHFDDARWACLPQIETASIVKVSEHTTHSIRHMSLLDACRYSLKLKTWEPEDFIALFMESDFVTEGGREQIIEALSEAPDLDVYAMIPCKRFSVYLNGGAINKQCHAKNGLFAIPPPGESVAFYPPTERRRKKRADAKSRMPVPGLRNIYFMA